MNAPNFRPKLKSVLATSTIAGMTAVVLATGAPSYVTASFAEPVEVEAPQAPSFADVVEAVSPAVVSVRVKTNIQPVSDGGTFGFQFGQPGFEALPDDHPMKRFFREFGEEFGAPHQERRGPRPVSQGSGFFISEDGYLVTNNHVVEGGKEFTVILDDGTELDAELVGTDTRTDLAVLKVDDDRKFTYVEFGDDSKTRIGDWVVAVGNPFGLGGTVTAGIVSARGREIGAGPYDDFIQVDAAVNRGNSGGPTFNLNGKVIGVNTAIFSPSGGNVGIAFAIPATLAKDVVNDLIDDGNVQRGWLGVQIQSVTDDIAESLGLDQAAGALVAMPQDNTPAKKAGVQSGDVITEVNGDGVEDSRDLARRIAGIEPGQTVDLTIWRDGEEQQISVELGTFPEEEEMASLSDGGEPSISGDQELSRFGLTVVPSDEGEGVVITDVDPDGPAAERGFQVGDVILRVQDQEVASADDIAEAISAASEDGRGAALFQLRSENTNRFIALPIERG